MGRSITSPGVVKSVQRGVASGNATITITNVDVSKSVIHLNGGASANVSTASTGRVPRVSAFTSTSITVNEATYTTNLSGDTNVFYSWQVVEYS
jgi:hypothetical protein